jgi:hypothetical protein|tara:strand:+ start:592 stop:696 length:105 start_codon:yes stop_codon:yes gene_type:complete
MKDPVRLEVKDFVLGFLTGATLTMFIVIYKAGMI